MIDGAPIDGPIEAVCLGGFVQICVDPPTSSITLNAGKLDTSSSSSTPPCQPYKATPALNACVITGQSIMVDGGLAPH